MNSKTPLTQYLIQTSFLLVGLTLLYLSLLWLSYLIPDTWIEPNRLASIDLINREPKRWMVWPPYEATKLDTFTDKLMFQKLANQANRPAIEAAMWNSGYVRYWFGIIPILRVLLILMDYQGIRILNGVILVVITLYCFKRYQQLLGKTFAWPIWLVMGMLQFWIFPLSLQYTPVYLISLWAILQVAKTPVDQLMAPYPWLLFLGIGSLCNFADLLTAPLLTFGLPFIVWLIRIKSHFKRSTWFVYCQASFVAINWLIGYAITWMFKWILGSLILKENLFRNAFQQMVIRTQGTVEDQLHYGAILGRMWTTLLHQPVSYILLITLCILGIKYRRKFTKLTFNSDYLKLLPPLVGVALLPFVWVFLLQNHNAHHYYFTYRIFGLSLLAAMMSIILLFLPTKTSSKEPSEQFFD